MSSWLYVVVSLLVSLIGFSFMKKIILLRDEVEYKDLLESQTQLMLRLLQTQPTAWSQWTQVFMDIRVRHSHRPGLYGISPMRHHYFLYFDETGQIMGGPTEGKSHGSPAESKSYGSPLWPHLPEGAVLSLVKQGGGYLTHYQGSQVFILFILPTYLSQPSVKSKPPTTLPVALAGVLCYDKNHN